MSKEFESTRIYLSLHITDYGFLRKAKSVQVLHNCFSLNISHLCRLLKKQMSFKNSGIFQKRPIHQVVGLKITKKFNPVKDNGLSNTIY